MCGYSVFAVLNLVVGLVVICCLESVVCWCFALQFVAACRWWAFGFVGFNGGLGWLGLILVFGFWALTLFTGWFSLRYDVVCLVLVYVLFEFASVAISGFRFGVKRRWVWVCLLALSGGFGLCLSGWF